MPQLCRRIPIIDSVFRPAACDQSLIILEPCGVPYHGARPRRQPGLLNESHPVCARTEPPGRARSAGTFSAPYSNATDGPPSKR